MEIIKTNDISSCLEIRKKVFVNEQKVPIELEIDEYDNPKSNCDHYLIIENGCNIGTFRCVYLSDDTVLIQRFCVIKEMRSKGYGYSAMDFIKRHYKNLGVRKLTLNAQCHAIPFYESCSFKTVSAIFSDAGIEHRKMEQDI